METPPGTAITSRAHEVLNRTEVDAAEPVVSATHTCVSFPSYILVVLLILWFGFSWLQSWRLVISPTIEGNRNGLFAHREYSPTPGGSGLLQQAKSVSAAPLHQSIDFAVARLPDRIPDNAQVGAEMI
jgi:hypothetical protein